MYINIENCHLIFIFKLYINRTLSSYLNIIYMSNCHPIFIYKIYIYIIVFWEVDGGGPGIQRSSTTWRTPWKLETPFFNFKFFTFSPFECVFGATLLHFM